MAKMTLITKKFELKSEAEAERLSEDLNKNKYKAKHFGSGVVTLCRQTKKLDKILSKHDAEEFIPSDFDKAEILK